jgi:hypothetical protein
VPGSTTPSLTFPHSCLTLEASIAQPMHAKHPHLALPYLNLHKDTTTHKCMYTQHYSPATTMQTTEPFHGQPSHTITGKAGTQPPSTTPSPPLSLSCQSPDFKSHIMFTTSNRKSRRTHPHSTPPRPPFPPSLSLPECVHSPAQVSVPLVLLQGQTLTQRRLINLRERSGNTQGTGQVMALSDIAAHAILHAANTLQVPDCVTHT